MRQLARRKKWLVLLPVAERKAKEFEGELVADMAKTLLFSEQLRRAAL